MNPSVIVALVALSLALPMVSRADKPDSLLTEAQARQKAQAFLDGVAGMEAFRSLRGSAIKTVRLETLRGMAPEPFWVAYLANDSQVHVQDRGGRIIRVINNAAFAKVTDRRRTGVGYPAPELPVSTLQKQALAVRAQFADSASFSATPTVRPQHARKPESQVAFDWERQFHGIPFEGASFSLTLDRYSGEVLVATLNNWAPLPTTKLERVTQKEAEAMAHHAIQERFGKEPVSVQIFKRIVTKNMYFATPGSVSSPNESRVAWVVSVERSLPQIQVVFLGIDVETGKLSWGQTLHIGLARPRQSLK